MGSPKFLSSSRQQEHIQQQQSSHHQLAVSSLLIDFLRECGLTDYICETKERHRDQDDDDENDAQEEVIPNDVPLYYQLIGGSIVVDMLLAATRMGPETALREDRCFEPVYPHVSVTNTDKKKKVDTSTKLIKSKTIPNTRQRPSGPQFVLEAKDVHRNWKNVKTLAQDRLGADISMATMELILCGEVGAISWICQELFDLITACTHREQGCVNERDEDEEDALLEPLVTQISMMTNAIYEHTTQWVSWAAYQAHMSELSTQIEETLTQEVEQRSDLDNQRDTFMFMLSDCLQLCFLADDSHRIIRQQEASERKKNFSFHVASRLRAMYEQEVADMELKRRWVSSEASGRDLISYKEARMRSELNYFHSMTVEESITRQVLRNEEFDCYAAVIRKIYCYFETIVGMDSMRLQEMARREVLQRYWLGDLRRVYEACIRTGIRIRQERKVQIEAWERHEKERAERKKLQQGTAVAASSGKTKNLKFWNMDTGKTPTGNTFNDPEKLRKDKLQKAKEFAATPTAVSIQSTTSAPSSSRRSSRASSRVAAVPDVLLHLRDSSLDVATFERDHSETFRPLGVTETVGDDGLIDELSESTIGKNAARWPSRRYIAAGYIWTVQKVVRAAISRELVFKKRYIEQHRLHVMMLQRRVRFRAIYPKLRAASKKLATWFREDPSWFNRATGCVVRDTAVWRPDTITFLGLHNKCGTASPTTYSPLVCVMLQQQQRQQEEPESTTSSNGKGIVAERCVSPTRCVSILLLFQRFLCNADECRKKGDTSVSEGEIVKHLSTFVVSTNLKDRAMVREERLIPLSRLMHVEVVLCSHCREVLTKVSGMHLLRSSPKFFSANPLVQRFHRDIEALGTIEYLQATMRFWHSSKVTAYKWKKRTRELDYTPEIHLHGVRWIQSRWRFVVHRDKKKREAVRGNENNRCFMLLEMLAKRLPTLEERKADKVFSMYKVLLCRPPSEVPASQSSLQCPVRCLHQLYNMSNMWKRVRRYGVWVLLRLRFLAHMRGVSRRMKRLVTTRTAKGKKCYSEWCPFLCLGLLRLMERTLEFHPGKVLKPTFALYRRYICKRSLQCEKRYAEAVAKAVKMCSNASFVRLRFSFAIAQQKRAREEYDYMFNRKKEDLVPLVDRRSHPQYSYIPRSYHTDRLCRRCMIFLDELHKRCLFDKAIERSGVDRYVRHICGSCAMTLRHTVGAFLQRRDVARFFGERYAWILHWRRKKVSVSRKSTHTRGTCSRCGPILTVLHSRVESLFDRRMGPTEAEGYIGACCSRCVFVAKGVISKYENLENVQESLNKLTKLRDFPQAHKDATIIAAFARYWIVSRNLPSLLELSRHTIRKSAHWKVKTSNTPAAFFPELQTEALLEQHGLMPIATNDEGSTATTWDKHREITISSMATPPLSEGKEEISVPVEGGDVRDAAVVETEYGSCCECGSPVPIDAEWCRVCGEWWKPVQYICRRNRRQMLRHDDGNGEKWPNRRIPSRDRDLAVLRHLL